MSRCLKCGYSLVLLSNRKKYECAKCSSLFPQREIDSKHFRVWNERQRLFDLEEAKLPKKQRVILSVEECRRRTRTSARLWRQNNREKCREISEKSYEQNREKILARKKIYRQEIKEQDKIRKKAYRHQHIGRTRQLARIHWWKQQQKVLALQQLKNNKDQASTHDISVSPPTSVLYHLLIKAKCLKTVNCSNTFDERS